MEEAIKILVIDDDAIDRKALRRALQKAELYFELEECSDGDCAISCVTDNEYHCVFLDYLLPGTDGLELLKRIRMDDRFIPVIVITNQGDEKIAVDMMKAGASDYIIKDTINAPTIKKIINNVTYLSEIEREKRYTKEALKNSEKRLMEAQRIAKIGSWEYHFDSDKVYWSEEMFRIFERDPETYTPQSDHFVSLFHPDDRAKIREGIDRAMSGEVFNLDIRILLPNDRFKYVNLNAYFMRDDDDYYDKFAGTVQDIEQRKQVEEELRTAKKMAEESGRVKEQFLANMSHEIRTPMNAIIGFANLLLKEQEQFTEDQQKYIHSIQHAGDNLMVIINDILDVSKFESGKFSLEMADFVLPDVVSNAVNMFKLKAQEKNNLKLSYEIEEDVPYHLIGDSVRLNQILVNLISNALKFTEKGHIKLMIKTLSQGKNKAKLRFTIEDTGIGIPKNKLNTIFKSFTQASSDTTRKYGGTGLGLTIVKKLVEFQQGNIEVESEVGKGTSISIDLPFGKNSLRQKLGVTNDEDQKDMNIDYPKNIKVLMAEDNEMNKELAKFVFKDIGWELDMADDGLLAIEMHKQSDYDVILMDIQMPRMDGYEATRKIRNELDASKTGIPIIAITAHALKTEIDKCLEVGMNDYISKPFKVSEIITKVCKQLPHKKQERSKEIPSNKNEMKTKDEKPEKIINLKNLQLMAKTQPLMIDNIINIFMKENPERMAKLQELLVEKDWQSMKGIAHKMKSSYSILGANRVKNLFETIEVDIINNNIDAVKIKELIGEIIELNEQIVEELHVEVNQ